MREIDMPNEKAVLTGLGVDDVLADFESVRQLTPEQFVRDILKKLDEAVCCGYNYRFGKDGSGTRIPAPAAAGDKSW